LEWEEPIKTGAFFVSINTMIMMQVLGNPLLYINYLGLGLLLTGFAVNFLYPTAKDSVPDVIMSEEQSKAMGAMLFKEINCVYGTLKKIFFVENFMATANVFLALYLFKVFVTPIFCLEHLAFLIFEGLFTLPYALEKTNLKSTVGPKIEMAMTQATGFWNKIPRASTVLAKKKAE